MFINHPLYTCQYSPSRGKNPSNLRTFPFSKNNLGIVLQVTILNQHARIHNRPIYNLMMVVVEFLNKHARIHNRTVGSLNMLINNSSSVCHKSTNVLIKKDA